MEHNIALGKVATASSYVLPYTPDKALNGEVDQINRWECDNLPGYLYVDLGDLYWIDSWAVYNLGLLGWPSKYNMEKYALYISDTCLNWEMVDYVDDNSYNITMRSFPSKACRYVQLEVISGQKFENGNASCVELQVYETSEASADLTELHIIEEELFPEFCPECYYYYLYTNNRTITVIPTTKVKGATVEINGMDIGTNLSHDIMITENCNIEIVITSKLGVVQRKYTIRVNE